MSFFLVPIVGAGTRSDPRRPKYIPLLGVSWLQVMFADTAIAWANSSPAQDSAVAANADALLVPALDSTIAVNATRNALEARDVPGNWVQAGMTYRSVLRVLVGMAQLVRRIQGLGVTPVIAGNLDKTISQLPANIVATLSSAVDSLGLDRSNITGSTLLRAALLDIGQQFIQGNTIALGDL